jgi:hypothetical protein
MLLSTRARVLFKVARTAGEKAVWSPTPGQLDAAIARGLAATEQGVPGVLEVWLPRLITGETGGA